MSILTTAAITGTASIGATDANKLFLITAAADYTISLAAAATLGVGWWAVFQNNEAITDTAVVTIDPSGSETIDGAATRVIKPGERLTLRSDGTNIEVYVDQVYMPGFGVSTNWSNRASYQAVGAEVFFTDVGVNGTKMRWTGSLWIPVSPCILAQKAIPIIIPPTGSMGANGAYTAGTAFDRTLSGWMYFAANQIFTGSTAGFYWAVGSSTTAFTVYNNTYAPGGDATPPASPTAFSSTGPGAITGVTAETTAAQWTIPGGLLGLNGRHRTTYLAAFSNSANSKYARQKLNATSIGGAENTETTARARGYITSFYNVGSASAQKANPYQSDVNSGNALSGGAPSAAAVDTAIDQPLKITLQHSTATDWVILESYFAEVFPA